MFTLEKFEEVRRKGQPARLIPTLSMKKAEERATSVLLACFMTVPLFAAELLGQVGAPSGKRIKVMTFTEVVFKRKDGNSNARPDGLILVQSGSKYWSALVESKVGNSDLSEHQVEDYVDIARELDIDAVITLSNQFALTPKHSPVSLSKQKLRRVSLYHFSWMYVLSKASSITQDSLVVDREQAIVLNELARYLEHDSSGISTSVNMPRAWRMTCDEIQGGREIRRNNVEAGEAIVAWHQLQRYLAISLSSDLHQPVTVALSKNEQRDPSLSVSRDFETLAKDGVLSGELETQDTASRIRLEADLKRRCFTVSMTVTAPVGVRPLTAVNWLVRQLREEKFSDGFNLKVSWARRRSFTTTALNKVIGDPGTALADSGGASPTRFTVLLQRDLLGKMKTNKAIVEQGEHALKDFYRHVGQNIKAWVPRPPQLRSTNEVPSISSDGDTGSNQSTSSTVESERRSLFPFKIKYD